MKQRNFVAHGGGKVGCRAIFEKDAKGTASKTPKYAKVTKITHFGMTENIFPPTTPYEAAVKPA